MCVVIEEERDGVRGGWSDAGGAYAKTFMIVEIQQEIESNTPYN